MVKTTRNSHNTDQSGSNTNRSQSTEINHRKRNLTLDLNCRSATNKKQKFDIIKSTAPVLSSPDLNMLKLASPELEKLIIQQNLTSATPTPSAAASALLFPKSVTEEQELFVKGFEDALSERHGSDSNQGLLTVDMSSSNSSNSMTYTELDQQQGVSRSMSGFTSTYNSLSPGLGVVIKDEPQTVPSICSSPPMSPINMECQEIIKLERKRQRNRVAASKCRKRKLERIARLEDKVKQLKGENTDLGAIVLKLKDQVCILKEQVMEHVQSGCQIMMAPQYC